MKKNTLKFTTNPFLNSKLLNSKGMSLVAVLVASAIGSTVVIGMTQYQTNLLNSINEIKQEGDLVILRSEIERRFFSKDDSGAYKVCTDTLKDFEDRPVRLATPDDLESSDDSETADNRDSRAIQEEIIPEAIGNFAGFASPEGTPEPTETPSTTNTVDTYEPPTIYNTYYEEGQSIKSTSIKIQRIEARLGDSEGDKEVELYIYFASNKANSSNLPLSRPLILNAQVNYQANTFKVESCAGEIGTSIATDCLNAEDSDPNKKTLLGCGTTPDNTAEHTVAIGYNAGSVNSTGGYNNFIGHEVGVNNTTGNYNNFIGHEVGVNNTTGNYNNFMGHEVGADNTTGSYNNFMGYQAGKKNTLGSYNNFMGYQAGTNNTVGHKNTFVGHRAGYGNTIATQNLCMGYRACGGNPPSYIKFYRERYTNCHNNRWLVRVSRGKIDIRCHTNLNSLKRFSKIASLDSSFSKNFSTLIPASKTNYFKGSKFIEYDSSFNEVVALGSKAGYMSSGDKNVFVGSHSGSKNILGEHNTFIGYNSGAYAQLGSYNIYIGSSVGASKDNNNYYPKKDKSYQLNLANTLYGNINKKPSYPFPIKSSSLVFDSHLTISKDLEVIGDITSKKDLKIIGSLDAKKANIKDAKLEKANIQQANIKNAKLEKANIKYLEVDYLKVNNPQYIASYQNPLSSKQYKKNIASYDNHEDSLNQILNIKLYNYNYKDKDHNPNKQRMGVISEYLDPVFQLKDNNINKNINSKTKANNKSIIMPDWPTIYGSLIASTKAIYNKLTNLIKDFQDFKKIMSSQLDKTNKELQDSNIQFNKKLEITNNKLNKELDKTNKELSNTNKELLNLKQDMLKLKKQIEDLKI